MKCDYGDKCNFAHMTNATASAAAEERGRSPKKEKKGNNTEEEKVAGANV